MDENNISEEIYSHENLAQIIDHTCDNNGINLLNIEEEVDFTSIHSINKTNDTSTNDDGKEIHKYYAPFVLSKDNKYVSFGT